MQVYGLTQQEISKKVGKSRSAVANSLRLLNLPEEILQLVEGGNLSEGQARALLSIDDLNLMKRLAKRAVDFKLSVRDLEKICAMKKKIKSKKSKAASKTDDIDGSILYQELAASIKSQIKRNVKIEVLNGEKGRLVIDFYNRDDLLSMANMLTGLKWNLFVNVYYKINLKEEEFEKC